MTTPHDDGLSSHHDGQTQKEAAAAVNRKLASWFRAEILAELSRRPVDFDELVYHHQNGTRSYYGLAPGAGGMTHTQIIEYFTNMQANQPDRYLPPYSTTYNNVGPRVRNLVDRGAVTLLLAPDGTKVRRLGGQGRLCNIWTLPRPGERTMEQWRAVLDTARSRIGKIAARALADDAVPVVLHAPFISVVSGDLQALLSTQTMKHAGA